MLTVSESKKNHDPMKPASSVSDCDEAKNLLQNCSAAKTRMLDSSETINESEVCAAARETKIFHLNHFFVSQFACLPILKLFFIPNNT
jgi:hypothetical protein